jgi:hypothetical protein
MKTKEKPKKFRAIMREAAEFACGGRADCNTSPGGPTHIERLPVTTRAFQLIYAVDRGLVGTLDYVGLACWWADEYKHRLRGATNRQRKKAHDAILAAGLSLDGVSVEHTAIIASATRPAKRKVTK